jgi:hypothetical protein
VDFFFFFDKRQIDNKVLFRKQTKYFFTPTYTILRIIPLGFFYSDQTLRFGDTKNSIEIHEDVVKTKLTDNKGDILTRAMKWTKWTFFLIMISAILLAFLFTRRLNVSSIRKGKGLPHYRAVVMVLASHNKPMYYVYRRLMLAYADEEPTVKFFFVYGKNTALPKEELTEHDLLVDFFDVQIDGHNASHTVYPAGFLNKTVLAMKDIDKRCTFDYLVRTNLSTFWYLKVLLKKLQALPRSMCFSGPLLEWFTGPAAAGFAIVLSYDLVGAILNFPENKLLLDRDYGIPEDVLLGNELTGIYGVPLLNSEKGEPSGLGPRTWYLNRDAIEKETALTDILQGLTNWADHFRLAYGNNDPRRSIIYYRILLQITYNICFPTVNEQGASEEGPCKFELDADEVFKVKEKLSVSEVSYDSLLANYVNKKIF